MTAPLILTLQLEPAAAAHFNQLRRSHYPAYANMVDAHVTLFHRLPADEPRIVDSLSGIGALVSFTLTVNAVQQYTNGVAYTLLSPTLQVFHHSLQQQWLSFLTWRDQQLLRPHITIMNKVTAYKAQQLHQRLTADFVPFEIGATGVQLWRYCKGPWELKETYSFEG
ncbi:2'-5' RNA ligase family protein [Chitinophaga sp. 22321]|uniref:2'-5' RNA ligase family protein n=1 Tax=Chitinophaga hostae TaxID=2831022 RepID=A0ABS5JAQ9_9BACT|nr:2'-5' RNA ligase family protein [Chitinophaga hostae]MBS0032291.1 2'-5' RNA ligase family protein [Chitinophaga hostae]